MEKLLLAFFRSFILFSRNLVGCINSPYVTYRRLSLEKKDLGQTIFIPFLVILYFIFATTIRSGIRNPYLLSMKFNTLLFVSAIGFASMVGLFYFLGNLFGGKASLRQIYLLWIYSLLPTVIWFFATSFLYLLFPPPRTLSILGKFYSVVFVSFSIAVLLWKIILYYLTLRFSFKIDLWKIIQISLVIAPFIGIYSSVLYRLGISKVPFL